MTKPRIAIVMDENTSADGRRYEAPKSAFLAIARAGGVPFGVPYLDEIVEPVCSDFDGLLTLGGRFAYPAEFYLPGMASRSPESERLEIERALVTRFLDMDKPILGICAGMQLLGCVNGCRMVPDLKAFNTDAGAHDGPDIIHTVSVAPDTLLAGLAGESALAVNSRHREAVVTVSDTVTVSAVAEDGVIEAIEIAGKTFALGVQWHQESFAESEHPGNGIFRGFVAAC